MWWWMATALAVRPEATGFADSEHFRCHWADEADAARCDEVLVWAEEAWRVQVEILGFRAPVPDASAGGTTATDIYVVDAGGAGMAYVDCDPQDPDCFDPDTTDGYAGGPAYVVIDPATDDAVFPHYVHHEFNHVLQYATDFAEPSIVVWEATAVAAERWTDRSWATSAEDVADFQATPWLSPFLQDGYFLADCCGIEDSWYEYGAGAWVLWLDARHGDGFGSVGPRLWDGLAGPPGDGNEPSVLDALSGIWGGPPGSNAFDAEVLDLATERVRLGTPAQSGIFPWDADPSLMAARQALVEGENTPVDPPFPYGMALGTLELDRPADIRLLPEGEDRLAMLVFDEDLELVSDGPVDGWSVAPGTFTVATVNLGPDGLEAGAVLDQAGFTWEIETEGCGCASAGSPSVSVALVALLIGTARRSRTPAGTARRSAGTPPPAPGTAPPRRPRGL